MVWSYLACVKMLRNTLTRQLLRKCKRTGLGIQLLQSQWLTCATMMLIVSKVYAILDEIFLAGEIQETSKDVVLLRLEELEKLE